MEAWNLHCRRVKEFGREGANFTAAVRAEYAEAKRMVDGVDLRDVARFWVTQNGGMVQASVAEATRSFLEAKAGRAVSHRHEKTLKSHLEAFLGNFWEKRISLISREDILRYLLLMAKNGAQARTVANHRGSLSNFFHWCKRNKLVAASPMEDIVESDLPVIPNSPIGVLSVAQCAALMDWVDKRHPRYAASAALQLFAGIRSAEVRRLRWEENFDFEQRVVILRGWRIEGGKAQRVVKTGDDWVLRGLPENLWAWLAKFRGTGSVTCPNADASTALHREFAELTPPIAHWAANALRHTFCTMLMSLHGDANRVATWSRHSNAQTLFNHYVAALVPPEEARRFCEIVPAVAG